MISEYRLTTYDNPYNPFKEFDKWFTFDVTKGYNTCELLGRFAQLSDSMTDQEENEEIESAIDRILAIDFECIYKKVTEQDVVQADS